MTTLVRAAVALAAALLGFGGFVAVQAASDSEDQPAKREDSLSALTTADDSPSPDDTPSPDDPAVQQDAPAVQDAAPDAVADPSTRTRTGRDAVDDRDDTRDVTHATGTHTRTRGDDDTSGSDTSGDTGGSDTGGSDTGGSDTDDGDTDDDRSGSSSGQG